jgi:RHS repeat-associated protein
MEIAQNFTKTCLFAFNGQERDDDIYGEGNAYDFGNRIYDARLGRWLSVDRLANKYPAISPYAFAENNPIIILDQGGDSTVYFSEGGQKLGVSWDNLENAIVVIKSNDVAKFTAQFWLAKISFKQDGDKTNEKLRSMGKAYSVPSFEKWYKGVKNIRPVEEWDGASRILVKGKAQKFLSEAGINLVIGKDGLIRVGNKKNQTVGDPTTTGIPETSGEAGSVDGWLHDHPNPRGENDVIMKNGDKGNYFGTHTTSTGDDDFSESGRPGNSGVINDESIIIYKKRSGGDNVNVRFDRKERFKR